MIYHQVSNDIPGEPKVEVSNERVSAKIKLRCKLDIHTALLSPPFYLRRRVGLIVLPGGNIKISNVLKISPQFRAVPLGLRYQGIGSSDTFSVFLSSKRNGLGWAQKVTDESLPATAPSAHSGFSKGRPCLHVMIIII